MLFFQKLEHRRLALANVGWSPNTKEKVKEALQRDVMSSETDATDDEMAPSVPRNRKVKRLVWESSPLKRYKEDLDKEYMNSLCSPKQRGMMARVTHKRDFSTRAKPANAAPWMVKGDGH